MWKLWNPSKGTSCGASFDALLRLSDEELFVHIRHEDGDAVAILYERYRRLVHRIAFHILRDEGEAEDTVQNVFVDLYDARNAFDSARGTVKIWLLQFTYHRSFRHKKQLQSRNFYNSVEFSEVQQPIEDAQSDVSGEIERKQMLIGALSLAGVMHRRVLELVCYEGLTLREAAAAMGETLENVRHYYYRGLQKIRTQLGIANGEKSCPRKLEVPDENS